MSLELLRELLRWTELGGAKEATFSRFCDELEREGLLRKLAMTGLAFARGGRKLGKAITTYMFVTSVAAVRRCPRAPQSACAWSPWSP